jgi:succinate-acetate transporter protein
MAQVAHLHREKNWTRSGPVVSRILPGDEIETLEDRAAATVADPAPLGLWGFATGTWILGTVFAGVFPPSATSATIPVLLVFSGVAQFIAGLFAYRRANMLDSTSFCAFGALNVLIAGLFAMQLRGALPASGDPIVLQGFVLLSFGFISLALTLAALPTNVGLVATMGLRTVGYTLVGIPALYGANNIGQHLLGDIGGWFLVVSALVAFYLGMALIVNSSWRRTVLPIGGEP